MAARDYRLRPATLADAAAIAAVARPADVAEVRAADGLSVEEAVSRAFRRPGHVLAGTCDGELLAIFGTVVISALGNAGAPWLIGSQALPRHAKKFCALNRWYVGEMMREFDALINFVDARNTMSMRWLVWLGFHLDPPAPYGVERRPFHRFHLRRGD